MDGGDDDPVVAEFDVLLNRSLEDGAYVLRFPHQPAARPPARIQKARFKKQNDVLELEYDTLKAAKGRDENEHFDVGGRSSMEDDQEQRKENLRTQTLRSERVSCPERAYCMGFVNKHNKTVHLVPMRGIFEMKPVLQTGYIDPNEGGIPLDTSAESTTASTKPKATPKLLDVVNYKKESARAMQESNRLTFTKIKKMEEQEEWTALTVFSRDNPETRSLYEKHMPDPGHIQWIMAELSDISDDDEPEDVEDGSEDEAMQGKAKKSSRKKTKGKKGFMSSSEAFDTSAAEYLNRIAPRVRMGGAVSGVVEVDKQGNPLSNNAHKISLEEEVSQKLKRGRVLRLEEILSYGSRNNKEVVQTLLSQAVLVRGAWALESEKFYREQMGEVFADGVDQSQENIRKRCAVRDLVLAVFDRNDSPFVDKSQITRLVKVPSSTLHDAMSSVAKIDKKNSKHWVLFAQDDPKFKKQFPKVYAQQKDLWKKRFYQALVHLGVSEDKAVEESGYSPSSEHHSFVKLEHV